MAFFLVLTASVHAQDRLERYDVFVGPSYVQHDIGHVAGMDVAGTVHLSKLFGVVGDFGLHRSGYLFGDRLHVYTYRFGPKFSLRKDRVTFFGQALVGASHITGTKYLSGKTLFETTLNEFNYHLGGGADLELYDWFAVRFASGYSYQRFQGFGTSGYQILAGPVFRFGHLSN